MLRTSSIRRHIRMPKSPDKGAVEMLAAIRGTWGWGAEIVHWTLDMEDPSCGVALGIQDVTYEHRLLLNQPVSDAEKRLLPKCASLPSLCSLPIPQTRRFWTQNSRNWNDVMMSRGGYTASNLHIHANLL